MATTGIRFNIDTSQAQSQIGSLNSSLEELEDKLRAANQAGDFSSAADLTHQIELLRNSNIGSLPHAPGIAGSTLAAGGDTQTLRQLDLRLELLNRTIQELTNQLDDSTSRGQHRDAFNISATLNNAEEERQRLQNERERINRERENGGGENGAMEAIKKYGAVHYLTQGLGYANQLAGIGFNYRTAMANGNYIGAGINALDSGAGIAQGLGGGLLGAGLMLGATPVGWGLMAAGGLLEVGGAVGKYVAGDKQADKSEAEAYERTLATSNGLNKLFTSGGTWSSNAARTENILDNGRIYAEGTGMGTLDFVNLATQYSRYGASSADDAMAQARIIANYANSTGADLNTIQNFMGTARRYGDNSDVLGYASQARQAAGMTKAQTQEFLLALQSVIEDGISNGYVKSTEDVSKTFTMFARLSDNNPLWQGQQGANRLRQMNNSIANATGMQSVSDVIVATAANDILSGKTIAERNALLGGSATGTYIDNMLLMEQGNNPAMFGQIAKNVSAMEGNNVAGQIERYKSIFGLNYKGAVDVYNMAQKIGTDGYTEADFQKGIESMQKDVNYQSEETRKQNAINSLDENVRHIAQSKFWDQLTKLEDMVRDIKNKKDPNKDPSVSPVTQPTSRNTAVKTGEEEKAVEDVINLDGTLQILATRGGMPAGYGGTSLANLRSKSKMVWNQAKQRREWAGGHDDFDEIFKKNLGRYAAADDGAVSADEVQKALMAHDKAEVQNAYNSGNKRAYMAALETMLKNLFSDVNLTVIE